MFHLWYTKIKGFSGMFSPRSHVWPLPLPHSLPNPQPRPALLKKDQGLPTWDSWHLPACCFTFASVCYKWICWTWKHLAETTSKFSQDPFTAPFFWETAVLKWSWVLVGLKGSEQTVRAGGRAGLREALGGRPPHGTVGVLSCAAQLCPMRLRCALGLPPLFRLSLSFSWTYKEPALMMTVMSMTVMVRMMSSSFGGSIL